MKKKADSILQEQLSIAELSQNKNLIFATLFSDAVNNVGTWTSTETFDRTLRFIERGLAYAKEVGHSEYLALGYIRKAALLRKRGEFDNALHQAMFAFSSLESEQSDSIKAALYIELGHIFLAKSEALQAYKNYNHAYFLAYTLDNQELQSDIYHHFAWLFHSLGDSNLARSNLIQSLNINTLSNNRRRILYDYIDLARITDKVEYVRRAIRLADSLKFDKEIMTSKKLLYAYYMVIERNSTLALNYLTENKELQQHYWNQGAANYYWNIGNIYQYAGNADSALHYYRKAEPEMQKSFAKGTRLVMFKRIGECYALLKNNSRAIINYEQALALGKEMRNFSLMASISKELSNLYESQGAPQKALDFSRQLIKYNDTLQQLAAKSDLALLSVARESTKAQKDLSKLAAKKVKTKNLQYWAIGAAIAFVFAFVLLLGMFPVKKVVVNLIGFFAFVCLFEFFVLLIDTEVLHEITHGEPLKIWLIKIVLIALLVPLQHFLEHALTHFVNSRRLMKLRQAIANRKWWTPSKKVHTSAMNAFEEDTAVL
ncbi:MAG: hypothetical protein WKF70_03950 [Chitinophagaceae bacterium]